ncbi:hypothetical protein GGX14DRAFT_595814 [Mycena pura]|uniref:Uncharacterized protein n=1 Tax=Mycena pura TaxID=153505 RepID=A0AAD6UU86_9AGAR|nr:hypothetical protein GGX14DRAFT_595814 [Mycena pura]
MEWQGSTERQGGPAGVLNHKAEPAHPHSTAHSSTPRPRPHPAHCASALYSRHPRALLATRARVTQNPPYAHASRKTRRSLPIHRPSGVRRPPPAHVLCCPRSPRLLLISLTVPAPAPAPHPAAASNTRMVHVARAPLSPADREDCHTRSCGLPPVKAAALRTPAAACHLQPATRHSPFAARCSLAHFLLPATPARCSLPASHRPLPVAHFLALIVRCPLTLARPSPPAPATPRPLAACRPPTASASLPLSARSRYSPSAIRPTPASRRYPPATCAHARASVEQHPRNATPYPLHTTRDLLHTVHISPVLAACGLLPTPRFPLSVTRCRFPAARRAPLCSPVAARIYFTMPTVRIFPLPATRCSLPYTRAHAARPHPPSVNTRPPPTQASCNTCHPRPMLARFPPPTGLVRSPPARRLLSATCARRRRMMYARVSPTTRCPSRRTDDYQRQRHAARSRSAPPAVRHPLPADRCAPVRRPLPARHTDSKLHGKHASFLKQISLEP